MENPEGSNKKLNIYDSGIEATIRNNELIIEEAKAFIGMCFELIKDEVELLDAETSYLEHMEGDKDNVELEKNITGTEREPKYSAEDIEVSNQKIKKIKASVKKLNLYIDEITLGNIHLDVINDKWKALQEKFNQIILRVDKAQLN